MTISNNEVKSKEFFKNLSKLWQNNKDYTYFKGINLSRKQLDIVEDEQEQMLIEGYAGTGKSLTLLYKFINVLIREKNKRVLFVTYNSTLKDDTVKRLENCSEYNENKENHIVHIFTFHEMAGHILKKIKIIDKGLGRVSAVKIRKDNGNKFTKVTSVLYKYTNVNSEEYKQLPQEERLYSTHDVNFISEEITWIKAMGFREFDRYLETERTGRSHSIRLTRNQRKTIFKIYNEYEKMLHDNGQCRLMDLEDYALDIIENYTLIGDELKYDYIFVDEVQDLDPMQLMALRMLSKKCIILSGDANQKIYKKCPISYEKLGFDFSNGRRKLLRKSYRSTAQIVTLANQLQFSDSKKKLTYKESFKDGDRPIIKTTKGDNETIRYLVKEIKKIHLNNPQKSIAIVRREELRKGAGYRHGFRQALEENLKERILDVNNYRKKNNEVQKQIFYVNPYDIKGLEFDVVFILDFNSKFYPNNEEMLNIGRKSESKEEKLLNKDILEFLNREKKLLYVAMTRAKEKLYLIADNYKKIDDISGFIYDFKFKDYLNIGFKEKELEIGRVFYNRSKYGKLYSQIQEGREEHTF